MLISLTSGMAVLVLVVAASGEAPASRPSSPWESGEFRWTVGRPLVQARIGPGAPEDHGGDWHSIKDPSVIRHEGRWHLFCTVRGTQRSHAIVHLSFADWTEAGSARWQVLPCHGGYFGAPQVFYYRPQKRWYLICQASDPSWTPHYQAAYSTSDDIADPAKWQRLKPMFGRKPNGPKAWLDFWVICDEAAQTAHLFFTSLDGKLWRSQTRMADFPNGWNQPQIALEGDIYEASHTYRLRGRDAPDARDAYVTLVEAQNGHGWRYYKAYLAERLEGPWRPLAAERDRAFASMQNVQQPAGRWTDAVSHVELVRSSVDERLEIDPADLQVVFQGVLDTERAGKAYGEIPWKLGVLIQAP